MLCGTTNHCIDFPHHQELQHRQALNHPPHLGYHQRSPEARSGDHFESHHSQYYPGPEHQALQGSFTASPYGSTPLSGSMTTSPQSSAFHFQQTSPRSDHFPWVPQPLTRSVSIADTEDLHNAYAAYHRSSAYPSIARRMNNAQESMPQQQQQPMHMMHPEAHHPEVHHPVVTSPYSEPSAYYPAAHPGVAWPMSIPPSIMPQPVPISESYGQPWYARPAAGLPNVQEEEHSHFYPPQHSQPQSFRPNPG